MACFFYLDMNGNGFEPSELLTFAKMKRANPQSIIYLGNHIYMHNSIILLYKIDRYLGRYLILNF